MISNKKISESTNQKPIRLKSGLIIVMIQWIIWLIIPNFTSGFISTGIGVFGGLLGGLAFFIWWAFFSRSPKSDRWTALLLMIACLAIFRNFAHTSIAEGLGYMMFFVYAVPSLCLAFIIWLWISQKMSIGLARITMVLTILLSIGVWTLTKSSGLSGTAGAQLSWRWIETNEEKLLSQNNDNLIVTTSNIVELDSIAEWPGFRGPNRDGIIHGIKIKTDWTSTPPIELWRRLIGPGCSSFAVNGNLIYTQEQLVDDETVTCYNLNSGNLVWRHHDKARFYDQHAGAGPRSTPTLSGNSVFTFGATGILNALNAKDGTLLWSKNVATDTDVKDSGWGFTSSPLVVDDVVVVAAAGAMVAYDINTGDSKWFAKNSGDSYSSPQLFTIDGILQILLFSADGLSSFSPTDGTTNWIHSWPFSTQMLQAAMTSDGDLILSAGSKKGVRSLSVTHTNNSWNIKVNWNSNKMRPDFNDYVVHKGFLYGYDGLSLACIDLKEGNRQWKKGRDGGQLLLLADQDLLIVLTEKGNIKLLEAKPDSYSELANIPAIEGKTWNHPVLVGDILLVRNTMEMVAFKLPVDVD